MDILVIGATGGSGRAACTALLARGHRVTAFARHASALPPQPGLTAVDGDATDRSALDAVMRGKDGVVITLGISEPPLRVRTRGARHTPGDIRSRGTAVALAAAERAGVRRVVVQSSYGVGPTRRLLRLIDRMTFALLLKPQIADTERQERLVRQSALNWTIVQPVYLTDDEATTHQIAADGNVRGRKVARRAVGVVHADLVESGALARADRDGVGLISTTQKAGCGGFGSLASALLRLRVRSGLVRALQVELDRDVLADENPAGLE